MLQEVCQKDNGVSSREQIGQLLMANSRNFFQQPAPGRTYRITRFCIAGINTCKIQVLLYGHI